MVLLHILFGAVKFCRMIFLNKVCFCKKVYEICGDTCCRVQKILSPEVYQPSSPLRSVQRDKNGKASGYKSQDSMSTPDKSPIRSISPPQARSKTSSKNRR